jgi:hypothetical protein
MPSRHRSRVNWALRWGRAAACLLAVAAYLAGMFWSLEVRHASPAHFVSVSLWRGQMRGLWGEGPGPWRNPSLHGWQCWAVKPEPMRVAFSYGPFGWRYFRTTGPGFTIYNLHLPLWPVIILMAPASLVAWRAHRHRPRASCACPSCNYDLSGLAPGTPCPECASTALTTDTTTSSSAHPD